MPKNEVLLDNSIMMHQPLEWLDDTAHSDQEKYLGLVQMQWLSRITSHKSMLALELLSKTNPTLSVFGFRVR
jgi:hypothetical protein